MTCKVIIGSALPAEQRIQKYQRYDPYPAIPFEDSIIYHKLTPLQNTLYYIFLFICVLIGVFV